MQVVNNRAARNKSAAQGSAPNWMNIGQEAETLDTTIALEAWRFLGKKLDWQGMVVALELAGATDYEITTELIVTLANG